MNYRMRTVVLNDRGQIVIPEEIRRDLGLKTGETLVLLEAGNDLLLKKEASVVKEITVSEVERRFWQALSQKAMESAWDEQDEEWEKHYPKKVSE